MRTLLLVGTLLATLQLEAKEIVIRAARVLDGRGHELRQVAVVIDGSRIVRIDRQPRHIDYDLGDRTLMPGGIDTHVHIGWHFGNDGRSNDDGTGETLDEYALFAAEGGSATLMGGITTVQSLGSPIDKTIRQFAERNLLPLPRVLTAVHPIADSKLTPDQLREAVRKIAADGADVVKIFASQSIRNGGGPTMSQEQMDAACGEAKRLGLRAAVHAHGPESVRRAVLAGCTSIEHGVLIDQPTLDLMAEHGTYFDPNIDLVFRNYFENKSHFLGIGNYTEEGFAQMEKAVPKALNVFKLGLKTKGLKMVFGTDAVAGSHGRNFQEIVYRVQKGGQDPMQAITSATSLAAESLGLGDRIGTIAPAYEADFIAVDGNPLRDITALERVVFVMKGGRVVKNAPSPPRGEKDLAIDSPAMEKMKVGILGSGDVGKSFARAFSALGHQVKIGSRSPEKLSEFLAEVGDRVTSSTFEETARFGDLVVVATLGVGTEEALRLADPDNFRGKVVIDATNPLDFSPGGPPKLAVGHSDSLGERVQRALPSARVVKAFNTVGNPLFFKPKFPGGPPDMFLCGNDAEAKKLVSQICQEFGWGAIDIGGIESSRYLEPMCMTWVLHGILSGSWNHAFKMLHK